MNGKRHRRTSHESGGLEGIDNGEQPTTTDSTRQKIIITEIEALRNEKSDSRITVGDEVETKMNKSMIEIQLEVLKQKRDEIQSIILLTPLTEDEKALIDEKSTSIEKCLDSIQHDIDEANVSFTLIQIKKG
uniref:Uncharacterized protein n=1 Tax=Panagrolaimus davidi TaxID=227884 RepID=A0A914QAA7_9BILA